ncbi:MAG: ABC transporter ATP-binding protein [Gammaproteobacteria bacterium]|nr:ABC transporter ATP-binding protein [Gammaproteobacteria bacterium]
MNAPHPASLELRGVHASIEREEVLHGIDIDVLPGELCFVLGAGGAGKSALLRCIAGIDTLTAGHVCIDGRNLGGVAAHRRNIALLPQSYPLWPNRNVAENVAFAPRQHGLLRGAVIDRVEAELGFVGLQEFADHLPAQLTAAQRQRVALARTLAADSPICLLDEPFGEQPARLRERLLQLLRRRQQHGGQTMLLATRDGDCALRFADRIVLLHNGELQQAGAPVELYDNPANRFVAEYFGNVNLIDGEIELVGEQAMFRGRNGIVIPLFDDAPVRPREATAMFRPYDLRIVGGKRVPTAGQIRLSGRIELIEFLGTDLRYGVDLAGTLVWMDGARRDNEPLLNVGDRVALALEPTHIRILER